MNGFCAIVQKGNFQEFLEKEAPDIFCIRETNIDDTALIKSIFINYSMKNMFQYGTLAKLKKVTLVWPYLANIGQILQGINVHEHNQEGRVLTLEYDNFFIISVYVPNSWDGCRRLAYRVESCDKSFHNYIKVLKSKKDVIICGDMNVAHNPIDLRHAKSNEGKSCYTIEERSNLSD